MFEELKKEIYEAVKDSWNPPHTVVLGEDFKILGIYDRDQPVGMSKNNTGVCLNAYGMDIYNVKCMTIYANTPGFEELVKKEEPKIAPTSKFNFGFCKQ